MTNFIDFFRQLGQKILQLNSYFGTAIASKEFEKNPFGDISVFIDKRAQEIVLKTIKKNDIECTLLSEESGLLDCGAKKPVLIVDPIDGSLNAKRGLPYSAFSIAVAFGEKSDCISEAYVINLSNGDEFWAIQGKGAYLNNEPIKKISQKDEIVAIEGIKKQTNLDSLRNIFTNFHRVRTMGSVALDMCYLATGAFDVFFHIQPSRIIDYAAAKLIAEECGGGLFEFNSKEKYITKIGLQRDKPFWAVSNIKKTEDIYNRIFGGNL